MTRWSAPDRIPTSCSTSCRRKTAAPHRGRLKIFLGYAAGVGKTYAMLEAARERPAEGVDVVVASSRRTGGSETERLLEGLEVLPRRTGGVPRHDADRPRPRRRAAARPAARPHRRVGSHQRAGRASSQAVPGRATSCSTPASTCTPPSTSSTWRACSTSWRRSPACASARRCPDSVIDESADESSSSTSRRTSFADVSPRARCTCPIRRLGRSSASSAQAT